MKAHVIYFLAIGMVLASYNDGNSQSLPYRINLEKGVDNIRSMPLSSLGGRLEYVPLETDTACLIESITNVSLTDSYIFVSDNSRIFQFDINGKYIKPIGRKGRGPGEYPSVGNFIVDADNRDIYVLSSRIVLVYDFDGKYKRDFKTDFPCRQFILNEKGEFIFHPFNMANTKGGPVYSWYITDKNGVVRTKIPNTLPRVNGGLIVPVSPVYMFNGTPHFMEFGVDTLYNYDGQKKKAYAIFNPGKMKLPPDPTMAEVPGIKGKIWVNDIREIKNLMFVNIWWDLSSKISNCVFDKSASSFFILEENGFLNDIDGGMTFWPRKIINENLMIDYADAFDLIKYSKEKVDKADKASSGQFGKVVAQLSETSNPVLIILRRK